MFNPVVFRLVALSKVCHLVISLCSPVSLACTMPSVTQIHQALIVCTRNFHYLFLILQVLFLFRVYFKLPRYSHVELMLISAFFCRRTIMLSQICFSSLWKFPNIHCFIGGLILHKSLVVFSLFIVKFSCFFILCLVFRRRISLFQCAFKFKCEILIPMNFQCFLMFKFPIRSSNLGLFLLLELCILASYN